MKKVLKDQRINDLISLKQKREMKRLHPFILYDEQDNQDTNNSKDLKNIIIKSMPKQKVLSFEVTGKPVAESNTFVLVNSMGTARLLEVE